MKIKNKEMYHIHRNGIYDDIWEINNKFVIDDNFISYFNSNLDVPSGVKCKDGSISPLDGFVEKVINNLDTDEKILDLKQLNEDEFLKKGKYLYYVLKNCMSKMRGLSIKNREEALEEVRLENYPNLPSRYHSIWVCDEKSLKFWLTELRRESTIYKLLLNGELFKSSDLFLPDDGETKENQKLQADKYWNPKFTDDDQEKKAEYLFQGEVKVLKKLNKSELIQEDDDKRLLLK